MAHKLAAAHSPRRNPGVVSFPTLISSLTPSRRFGHQPTPVSNAVSSDHYVLGPHARALFCMLNELYGPEWASVPNGAEGRHRVTGSSVEGRYVDVGKGHASLQEG